MQYTQKHKKIKHPHHRNRYKPNINPFTNLQTELERSPEQREKKLMLELISIDHTLQKNNGLAPQYKFHKGYLISQHHVDQPKQHIDKLVNALDTCLKKIVSVVQYGFRIGIMLNSDDLSNPQTTIGTKYNSINERLIQKSLQNIRQYDRNNIRMYKKPRDWIKYFPNQYTKNIKESQLTPKKSVNITSTSQNVSKSTLQRQYTGKDELPSIYQRSVKTTHKPKGTQRVQTEQSRISTNQPHQIAKNDIRLMLKRSGKVIGIWVPPATYPQFLGMFCYIAKNIQKKRLSQKGKGLQSIIEFKKCKLTKYFFYRHSLSKRLFEAILEWVSSIQGQYIELLQIITNKEIFVKTFEIFGWKLRAWQANNKVRIQFKRNQS